MVSYFSRARFELVEIINLRHGELASGLHYLPTRRTTDKLATERLTQRRRIRQTLFDSRAFARQNKKPLPPLVNNPPYKKTCILPSPAPPRGGGDEKEK